MPPSVTFVEPVQTAFGSPFSSRTRYLLCEIRTPFVRSIMSVCRMPTESAAAWFLSTGSPAEFGMQS